MPYFSVILPTYNRSTAIQTTINSVLHQTEENWELLVVSDGSTDDTEEIVREYEDKRVRLILLPRNHGHPGRPRNEGLAQSSGQIVTYIDHDDYYEPCHLALLEEMFTHEHVRLVSTRCRYFDETGATIGGNSVSDMTWSHELQLLGPIFRPTQVAHRVELPLQHGGWIEQRDGLEDWELWVRFADCGERFVTSRQTTVGAYAGENTRLGRIPLKYALDLVRVRDKEDAQHRIQNIKESGSLSKLRQIRLSETQMWLEELHRKGGLTLPANTKFNDLLSALPLENPENALDELKLRHTSDSLSIAVPLPCTSEILAARAKRTMYKRFRKSIRFIKSELSQPTGTPKILGTER